MPPCHQLAGLHVEQIAVSCDKWGRIDLKTGNIRMNFCNALQGVMYSYSNLAFSRDKM